MLWGWGGCSEDLEELEGRKSRAWMKIRVVSEQPGEDTRQREGRPWMSVRGRRDQGSSCRDADLLHKATSKVVC